MSGFTTPVVDRVFTVSTVRRKGRPSAGVLLNVDLPSSVSEREVPDSVTETGFCEKLVALLGNPGSRSGTMDMRELFSADEVLGSLRLLLDKFDGYACNPLPSQAPDT